MGKQSIRFAARRQQGAALVIGLVLLLVLTLLAVSSMNSASLEFIMAGNEQYRSNAFQSAEAGIEQTLIQGTFNPSDANGKAYKGANGTDAWNAVVNLPLGGAAQPALWGNSWNAFSTFHFEILSTGSSTRGASALNTQGVALFSPYSPDVQADPNQVDTSFK
jgi:type IV pilus assembly protein PilX